MTSEGQENGQEAIRVDIVSDVVCPWCIVGFKQLEKAQTETEIPIVVHWHPFELNPGMPAEGQDLYEHITEKYGTDREASLKAREKFKTLGQELGFTFDYADDMRMVNTFRAHQAIHWAGSHGKQHAMKMALFEAYFSHRANVDDPAILGKIATAIGLNASEALAALTEGRFADKVREHAAFWTERGVTGVPTMLFDGRQALIGAQGVENYRAILVHMVNERAAAD